MIGPERGPSDFHQRHRFVAQGTVALPWRTTFTTVATLDAGLPINALTGTGNEGDTVLVDRPINPETGMSFARTAFRRAGHRSFDALLAKSIALRSEQVGLELHADLFTLCNGSTFYNFNKTYGNGTVPAATFRQSPAGIANVDPGRQVQFGLRLIF